MRLMLCAHIVALGVLRLIRTYSRLKKLKTFEERYEYLRLKGIIGVDTFGFDRYLNQILYTSKRWLNTRDEVIIRDLGCDLGVSDYVINGIIIVHHMNPLTMEDVTLDREDIYDPDLLICTSHNTHNAIHYSDRSILPRLPIERSRNDTCPWR